jgi:hypothetical protein
MYHHKTSETIMYRPMIGFGILAAILVPALPQTAAAQVSVSVQLSWEWGDDGWHSYEPAYRDVYVLPSREVVYVTPARTVRVPRGHLPPAGYCRLWYPGRPPGHQPAPEPCRGLFHGHHHLGAVILGAPSHEDVHVPRYAADHDRRGPKPRRGRGRGRGRH